MKRLNYMIEVMQAFAAGETIEYMDIVFCTPWEIESDPIWNWSKFNYRIKPEPEYVPFDKDDMLITMPIVSKYNPYQRLSIQSQDGISVLISAAGVISKARWITYKELFDEFLQIDKKPCGKLGVKTYKMRGIPPFMTERNGEGSNE